MIDFLKWLEVGASGVAREPSKYTMPTKKKRETARHVWPGSLSSADTTV
jgi:hypothetical protein